MYAVIFKAEIRDLDEEYSATTERLRTLAFEQYGCCGFTSCTEGEKEIAISYWRSESQIQAWKNDPTHREAQRLGRSKWYRSWQVQVVEILREYGDKGKEHAESG